MSQPTVCISINIPSDLNARLMKLSKDNHRKKTDQIAFLIERACEEAESEKKGKGKK